jgi:DNA-binding transcriptional ArsR family regulator
MANLLLDMPNAIPYGYILMRNHALTYSTEATFRALADPTRRAVLDLLLRGGLPAGQIAQEFPVSRPAISKHLRVLKRARLVRMRPSGRQRLFEVDSGPLKAVDTWLSRYRAFWQNELSSLKRFVEAAQTKEVFDHPKKRDTKKTHLGGKHASTTTDSNLRRNR